MRKLIFFLVVCVALTSAFHLDFEKARKEHRASITELPEKKVKAFTTFDWPLDIFRIITEWVFVIILSPLFFIPSLLINN